MTIGIQSWFITDLFPLPRLVRGCSSLSAFAKAWAWRWKYRR